MRVMKGHRNWSRSYRWRVTSVLVACVVVIAAAGLTWNGLRPAAHRQSQVAATPAAHVAPPVSVCGNNRVLGGGPVSAPAGAVTVPAGDDSAVDWGQPGATYWFAPGTHTLGAGQYTQIIPGAGAKFIGAPGAVIDGEHDNLYAFGGGGPDVTISYLMVRDFGANGDNQDQGVVNHDSASGWTIDHSTLADNAGAGTMLGSDNTLSYDCLTDNQQYGFNAYSTTGPVNLVIDHNEISGNDTYNWEARTPGCGCTGGGKFWDVNGAVITDNWVHGNHSVGLWADTDNRGFEIENNDISDNYNYGLIYEISYNALIKDNTFAGNGIGAGPTNSGFPTSAIYISESGSDGRVTGKFGSTFQITGNDFVDNWGGVILWENSNRFCNSPANSSTGACTLVDPGAITVNSCDAQNIARSPYYSDCRWKTQNVMVDHNEFDFSPASIGPTCTLKNECGFQGVFSEYGTFPSWSPYTGTSVENHITFDQNNHFAQNVYHGPWRYMVLAQDNVVRWAAWRSGPYHQDAGSTLDSQPPQS
jgi:hypothetical protein